MAELAWKEAEGRVSDREGYVGAEDTHVHQVGVLDQRVKRSPHLQAVTVRAALYHPLYSSYGAAGLRWAADLHQHLVFPGRGWGTADRDPQLRVPNPQSVAAAVDDGALGNREASARFQAGLYHERSRPSGPAELGPVVLSGPVEVLHEIPGDVVCDRGSHVSAALPKPEVEPRVTELWGWGAAGLGRSSVCRCLHGDVGKTVPGRRLWVGWVHGTRWSGVRGARPLLSTEQGGPSCPGPEGLRSR